MSKAMQSYDLDARLYDPPCTVTRSSRLSGGGLQMLRVKRTAQVSQGARERITERALECWFAWLERRVIGAPEKKIELFARSRLRRKDGCGCCGFQGNQEEALLTAFLSDFDVSR